MESREEMEARVYNLTLDLQKRDLEVHTLKVKLLLLREKLRSTEEKLRKQQRKQK